MKSVGATIFMTGLGQVMFQFYLFHTGGYWPSFSLADFLAEFGFYTNYGLGWAVRMLNGVLSIEMSYALLLLGALTVVGTPLWRVFRDWQAIRLIQQGSAEARVLQRTMH